MQTIMEILEKFESLIYKILVWIVLIPKTLLQVVLHPDWAPSYINQELGEEKPRFDEYFSPVVLLLLVALLPFLLWNFLPPPGVEITSPSTENPSTARTVDFEANIRFTSTSTDGFVTTFWRVEKEFFDGENFSYPVLQLNRYTNNPAESNPLEYFDYNQIDSHTIQDIYRYEFTETGNYWVVVEASKFDVDGYLIEKHSDEIHIYVPPEDSQENVNVHASTKPDDLTPFYESLTNQLKSEKTIFLALGLLVPPLLFTVAIKMFGKDPLSEGNLKETFYVQCYYFAPLAFIFWATRYAGQFFTPDVFFRYDTDWNLIILLPLILALFWFVSVQTHAISREANIGGGLALLVVLVCMFILVAGASFIIFNDQPNLQDITRKSSIWLYALLAVGLLVTYHILSILQRRKEKVAIPTGDKVLVGGIIFIIFITMCLVLGPLGRDIAHTSKDIEVTQQMYATQSFAALAKLAAEKFYTEEFDGNLDVWSIVNLGDESALIYGLDSGRLHVELLQQNDQVPPGVYFVKTDYLYTDVEVETSTTDTSSNANGVSLVCRSSDAGWYEFEVYNFGLYSIYAYDHQTYTELASGDLPMLKTDGSENKYTAICKGNELTLVVNDTPVVTIPDTKFNFTEGLIGIAVFSVEGLPVDVNFEYVDVREPTSTREPLAPATVIVQPTEAIPADTSLPEAQPYYTEEFDGSLDAWNSLSSDENLVSIRPENGTVVFQILPSDENAPRTLMINDAFTYAEVLVEAVVTNIGNNSNEISLICRFSDSGWYEFAFSNGGSYSIKAFDSAGTVSVLANGPAAVIKTGKATNVITALCIDNELTLLINGTPVETITESDYNFTEGKIGIGVASPQGLPVDVQFESLTVSEP
jgi:hypothetical protein